MVQKHIWICAFMAVGAKHLCTVGEVEKNHNAEVRPSPFYLLFLSSTLLCSPRDRGQVRALIDELAGACTKALKIEFPAGVADRLCAYARRCVAVIPRPLLL